MDSDLSESKGELLLTSALLDERPIVAILGQNSGWSKDRPDPVLSMALEKAEAGQRLGGSVGYAAPS